MGCSTYCTFRIIYFHCSVLTEKNNCIIKMKPFPKALDIKFFCENKLENDKNPYSLQTSYSRLHSPVFQTKSLLSILLFSLLVFLYFLSSF
jgi:hypothetical protein